MPSPSENDPIERNLGPQPLEAILTEHGLDNHDLVAASAVPLTHKAVQRARKGRRLTPHMQQRIAETLNRALAQKGANSEKIWQVRDLFTY